MSIPSDHAIQDDLFGRDVEVFRLEQPFEQAHRHEEKLVHFAYLLEVLQSKLPANALQLITARHFSKGNDPEAVLRVKSSENIFTIVIELINSFKVEVLAKETTHLHLEP